VGLFPLEKGSDAYVYRRRDLTPPMRRRYMAPLEKGSDASGYERRYLAPLLSRGGI